MEQDLTDTLLLYKKQLSEVDLAIAAADESSNIDELTSLRTNIQELINLTQETQKQTQRNQLEDEFSLFMSEMEKEGATSKQASDQHIEDELKSLEGMKCRAPHKHQWGDVMYHNAVVCSVIQSPNRQVYEEIKVKVMFINPTHEEMLPCPFLMESNCKFDDDRCKYSHGEVVLFSSLQEYDEPNFELLKIGSNVLAKQSNKLWSRAIIKNLFGQKCVVKFDSNKNDCELELQDVLLLENNKEETLSENSDSDIENDVEDVVNMSLTNIPTSQALGDWERHTKGIGSKIMQKMGYITGTGLGRFSDGRTEPVSAVILPPGKSLDHCMNLKEKAGGDKNLFSVEKKLKKLQKKQELKNMKAYERETKRVDVFNFLNKTLSSSKTNQAHNVNTLKNTHRQEIKNESSKNLNVASLKIEEDIKRTEREIFKIKESLQRHSDIHSQIHKSLKQKLILKQKEMQALHSKASNISLEQNLRNDKKKMTVF